MPAVLCLHDSGEAQHINASWIQRSAGGTPRLQQSTSRESGCHFELSAIHARGNGAAS